MGALNLRLYARAVTYGVADLIDALQVTHTVSGSHSTEGVHDQFGVLQL